VICRKAKELFFIALTALKRDLHPRQDDPLDVPLSRALDGPGHKEQYHRAQNGDQQAVDIILNFK